MEIKRFLKKNLREEDKKILSEVYNLSEGLVRLWPLLDNKERKFILRNGVYDVIDYMGIVGDIGVDED